ncbi:MAG: site-specific integrase [Schleiferiaceae bacterium]
MKEVVRPYLNEEELNRLIGLELHFDRLERVRDMFLFSCFTGLSYADVKKLKREEIECTSEGNWIKTRRRKTGQRAHIPLLSIAWSVIEKYNPFFEELLATDRILPILSNQKMNAYLKELATLAQIDKQLSFHIARHTFATTVTMLNGVPIESVSKMLGHKSIRSTQLYARIVDQKVGEDMRTLATRLENKTKVNWA